MDLALLLKTIVIGLVEGITEFLPISSTGHIILAEEVLHFEGPQGKVFEIVIQLGAILAVCVLYYAKIFATIGGVMRREPVALRFATAVIVAFLPAAVVGVALHKYIKALLDKPVVVAAAFIVGGIAILVIERFAQRPRVKSVDDINWKTALFVGFCQCLAMIPGVSRSGATILGAELLGVERKAAAHFTFYLAVPTMLGASVLELYQKRAELTAANLTTIGIGFVVSFAVAYVVVKTFIDFVGRFGLKPFGWYRIATGALLLVSLAFT